MKTSEVCPVSQVCPAFKDTQVRWGVSPRVPQKRRSNMLCPLETPRGHRDTQVRGRVPVSPHIEGDTDGTRVRGLARETRKLPDRRPTSRLARPTMMVRRFVLRADDLRHAGTAPRPNLPHETRSPAMTPIGEHDG
jgi:hypothetical protein